MYLIILIIHIAFGTVALLSGASAIVSKKGGKFHTRSGMAYYTCMYGIGVSALIMTTMKFNPFLMSIAIFSVYLAYSGKRAIKNWRLKESYIPTLRDRLPFYAAIIAGLFMVIFPVVRMIQRKEIFVPILAVFGVIMLLSAIRDIKKYADKANFHPRNKMWLIHHIGMMGGAYIATFTAFVVNNFTMERGWILWLSPTVVGVILITAASVKWSKKLNIGRDNRVVAGNAV